MRLQVYQNTTELNLLSVQHLFLMMWPVPTESPLDNTVSPLKFGKENDFFFNLHQNHYSREHLVHIFVP